MREVPPDSLRSKPILPPADGRRGLFGLVVRQTLRQFFRGLPMTIGIAVLTTAGLYLANLYALGVLNDGWRFDADPPKLVTWLGFHRGSTDISGQVTWPGFLFGGAGGAVSASLLTVLAPALLMKFLRKGPAGVLKELAAVPREMRRYFHDAGPVAASGLCAGTGAGLVIGGCLFGYSSLAMAVGMGAFMTSQGSRVVSLLLSSTWSSTYSACRKGTPTPEFPLAAGYLGMAGSCLGMLIRQSMQTGTAFLTGAGLLAAALFLIKGPESGSKPGAAGRNAMTMFWAALLTASLLLTPSLLADDGGFKESNYPQTFEGFLRWLRDTGQASQVRDLATLHALFTGALAGGLNGLWRALANLPPEIADQVDPSKWGNQLPSTPPPPPGRTATPPPLPPRTDLIDPYTGEPLIVQDGRYQGGKPGQVWWGNKWVDPEDARDLIREEQEAISRREREREAFDRETRRLSDERAANNEQRAREAELEMARSKAERETMTRLEKERQDRVDKGLERMLANEKDPARAAALQREIEALRGDDNRGGLEDLYRDRLGNQISQGQKDAADANFWASVHGAGEIAAQLVRDGAKAGLLVVGGPAGIPLTAGLTGVIGGAGEGMEGWVEGRSMAGIIAKTGAGFLGGMKDGAIGAYANLPGTGAITKILLPAAGDAAEVFVRTGDGEKAIATGLVSAGSGWAGQQVGELGTTATKWVKDNPFYRGSAEKVATTAITIGREGADALVSGLSGGATSYVNGGSFGDGFQSGLVSHVGGRLGSTVGQHKAAEADPEAGVNKALEQWTTRSRDKVPMGDQAPIVKELESTRRREPIIGPDGQQQTNAWGFGRNKDYVDDGKTLEMLRDPAASRTAKNGPRETVQAIINTRNDRIYAPADQNTINHVREQYDAAVRKASDPATADSLTPKERELVALLQPDADGNPPEIKMDTFSTPGKPPSLGADRDARMTVVRRDANGVETKVEVPLTHWEQQGYKDFYDHTRRIAGIEGDPPPGRVPEYDTRLEELAKANGLVPHDADGLTADQIANLPDHLKHKAWGEAHNQLFTDKGHAEASRDNSDQYDIHGQPFRPGALPPGANPQPSVISAQEGRNPLADPTGYARMWEEKSRFYEDMLPAEAVAQSQKGIEQHMRLREGYRQQDVNPPPIRGRTADAMQAILESPVGVTATPERMAALDQRMRDLGYQGGLKDAMADVAMENEYLKLSTPGAAAPVTPITGQQFSALGRSESIRQGSDEITDYWQRKGGQS